MNNQPLFEDNSTAGYDQTCHNATWLIADTQHLNLDNPDNIWKIIHQLETWTSKLRLHTPPATPWQPTHDNPY